MIENHGVGGSIPPPGTTFIIGSVRGAGVAQLVEHLTRNEKVCGSIPHTSSSFNPKQSLRDFRPALPAGFFVLSPLAARW